MNAPKLNQDASLRVRRLREWLRWQIFKLCVRFNLEYTTVHRGRVWSTKRQFIGSKEWHNQRIHFNPEVGLDFVPKKDNL